MRDSDGLQHTLFPRLRREKEASQPAGCQQLIFVATNMLVFVFGQQGREKDLWCFFFAIFAFFVANPALIAGLPCWGCGAFWRLFHRVSCGGFFWRRGSAALPAGRESTGLTGRG
jgi:hypothetical protein